jgi:hypothetical protein
MAKLDAEHQFRRPKDDKRMASFLVPKDDQRMNEWLPYAWINIYKKNSHGTCEMMLLRRCFLDCSHVFACADSLGNLSCNGFLY